MGRAKRFLLLMWKNAVLLKRGPTRTLFHIALPLVFMIILVLLQTTVIKTGSKVNFNYQYPAFEVNQLPAELSNFGLIGFAPNTCQAKQVVDLVKKQLLLTNTIGFENEESMVQALTARDVSHVLYNNTKDVKSFFLGGIVFDESLNHQDVSYKIRLSSDRRANFTERENLGDPSAEWNTQRTFRVSETWKPTNKHAHVAHGGPPYYFEEGFLAIQHAVNIAIMKHKGKIHQPNATVAVKRFPNIRNSYENSVALDSFFGALFLIFTTLIMLNIILDILAEKEEKVKESLNIIGVTGWQLWLALFIKYFMLLLSMATLTSVLFLVKLTSNERIVGQSSPSVIFVFLALFSLSVIMFCFCISVFLSKANLGTALGGFLWFFTYTLLLFVAKYYSTLSFTYKAASCLFPNVAEAIGALLIHEFEVAGTGSQWSNLSQGPSVDDSFSLYIVMVMFVVDSLLYGLIAWYVETVFPGDSSVPQPWYFPVLPSYWCRRRNEDEMNDLFGLQNIVKTTEESPELLEKDPLGLVPGIEIRNLRRVFSTDKGDKAAVDNVSLTLYKGQITVLLGQNGAGKTTLMSMLAGLIPATSGSFLVKDVNVRKVHNSLGFCPERDVLFHQLTVEENLWFFAKLKDCPSDQVKQEVNRMIDRLSLTDKRHTRTGELPDAMKRKLSVGIAMIGNSKIVMLDEPTAGMDPIARRSIWDLIQQQKRERTIFLNTHCVDEADVLGDRIVVMVEGKIKCCGSPVFLKNKYGLGYRMVMVKFPNCDVAKVIDVIRGHIPNAQLESNAGDELAFTFPKEAIEKFEDLLTEMETRSEELGIAKYGASIATMEDVFLKIGKEMDNALGVELQSKEEENASPLVYENVPVPSERSAIISHMISSESSYGTFTDYKNYMLPTGFRLFSQRWFSLFAKRLLLFKRQKMSTISQLLLPLACTLTALVFAKTAVIEPTDFPALSLSTDNFQTNTVPWATDNSSGANELGVRYASQWRGDSTHPAKVNGDMQLYLASATTSDVGLEDMKRKAFIAASFATTNDKVNVTAWFNNQGYHAIAVSLAAADQGILQYYLGTNYSITTVNHPLPRKVKKTVNYLTSDGLGLVISFSILFGMASLASSFVVLLVQERSNKAKHVQFVSGVDPLSYWSSAYTWDLINFFITALLILGLVAVFNVPAFEGPRLGYLFLLLMLYGWAIIPLMYLFSFVFRTASTAFVTLTMFNIITGLLTLMTVHLLSIPEFYLLSQANDLTWAFLFLPNFCLGQGINNILDNYNALNILSPNCKTNCSGIHPQGIPDRLQFQQNYAAWDNPGIGRYLVALTCEGFVFFALLLFIEYKLIPACTRSPARTMNAECSQADNDVLAEETRIMASGNANDVLVTKELTKTFAAKSCGPPLVAVDNLSFGVSSNECFGLLGINGAGKTTAICMLTGEEAITSGTTEIRRHCGYCPQSNALIDQLTGRELLTMYARLRGLPETIIADVVEDLIQALLLQDHADKVTSLLSGGNRRKLSAAIAMIGDPPVVILDEPTKGMDPVARRLFWNVLSRYQAKGGGILLTTQSMTECEALCTRLSIMVNGRLKCLGSPHHIKNKFGPGYTITARISGDNPDTKPFKEFMTEWFPGSVLKDEHQGMVYFHVCNRRVTWAQLFGTIERVKWNFNIDDYYVGPTTLEQVFVNFARGQGDEIVYSETYNPFS
ncbi:phospholipid-transporting ATPase ABCA3-like [Montipora foliosa]|uniref:phospholipid-transporting ATPase ABCA3-like n=1 Tax=Montipora foliosa TaxID=591990 RepID=UPI0035F12939